MREARLSKSAGMPTVILGDVAMNANEGGLDDASDAALRARH